MDSEKSVLVMMTTYNGEKFLREQLESILLQSYRNFKLVIQDDGSTDGTEAILLEYAERDKRISLRKNEGPHGAYSNFHALVNAMKEEQAFDYYMFADHDDVWMPEKIAFFVDKMNRYRKEVPVLLYADMRIIDENGNVTSDSLNGEFGIKISGRWSCFYQHSVFGCNTMINRALFKAIPPVDTSDSAVKILSHDNYFTKYAALYGVVFYFPEITMSYRRYGKNVTAANQMTITPKRVLSRLLAFDRLARDHARTYVQTLYALDRFMPGLAENEKKTAEQIRRSIEAGGVYALFIFLKLRVDCGRKVRTVSRALVLLTGIYRKYLKAEEFI